VSDTTVVVVWGRQIDCAAQGCEPPCRYNGVVYTESKEPDRTVPARLDNHAARWVRHTITYSPWEAAE
jgi:hypothetical protein